MSDVPQSFKDLGLTVGEAWRAMATPVLFPNVGDWGLGAWEDDQKTRMAEWVRENAAFTDFLRRFPLGAHVRHTSSGAEYRVAWMRRWGPLAERERFTLWDPGEQKLLRNDFCGIEDLEIVDRGALAEEWGRWCDVSQALCARNTMRVVAVDPGGKSITLDRETGPNRAERRGNRKQRRARR